MALVRAAEESSSSNYSGSSRCSYHVFLSFRGEDTRKTFSDHLYTALVNAGFRTFRDDDELERGEGISPGIERALQQSRSSVIVFSKDFASSKWCLDELVMILERRRTSDHVVLPVFYDIDPSHVRKQTGSVAKSFARHGKKQPSEKLNGWRAALKEAADLAGMVLQNQADGHESKFIKKLVKVMEEKLSRMPLSVTPYLVGIDSQLKSIDLWLKDETYHVGVLGICGIGGVGKTTIAQVVYSNNFKRFQACSFLENIRENSDRANGLVKIQKQLLYDMLNMTKVKIRSVGEGIIKIRDVISSRKVLIVLDDVDHMDQLSAIFGMRNIYFPGSKIIITTRFPGLLKAHQVDKVHQVEPLNVFESLKLFSWHAFRQNHPVEEYIKLSERVVRHSGGLPLALQVLGSSLMGQRVDVWESQLQKLKVIPNNEIVHKLKISYDSLQDDHDKELFLHLACFFIGKGRDVVVLILDECDFYTTVGIQNLIDRCLVKVDGDNKVEMHQMIRDMGREIVRFESKKEPENRSRLWHHKDSFNILKEKNGSKRIEGLALDMHIYLADTPRKPEKVVLETKGFTRMKNLKFLQLSHVQLGGSYEEFPKRLRWLFWLEVPLDSIPSDFLLESLVVLEMCCSSLTHVWKGKKNLPFLKVLDLSHSYELIETGDFSLVPNLERLILEDCPRLLEVHDSIGKLETLVCLNMKDCKSIRKLPNLSMLKQLETLVISGCSNLSDIPMEMRMMESLKVLEADETPIKSVKQFWALPCTLVVLSLANCSLSDDAFPDFGNLSLLKKLDLSKNPIGRLPNFIRGIRGLNELILSKCGSLKSLVGLPKLTELVMFHCGSLERITFQSVSCIPKRIRMSGMYKLVEIEYWYKFEPIGRDDAEMINLLGLCNLETLEVLYSAPGERQTLGRQSFCRLQGLYEYGIFSTFIPGNEVPGQFSHKSIGIHYSITFTVPLLPNLKIRGLNIFCVYRRKVHESTSQIYQIIMEVKNKSNGLKWIYAPSYFGIPRERKDLMIWLSHWQLENQIQGGDEVNVSAYGSRHRIERLGIEVVREEDDKMSNRQQDNNSEDLWHNYDNVKHGYMSEYQVIPGKYFLFGLTEHREFVRFQCEGYFKRDIFEDYDNREAQQEQGEAELEHDDCGRMPSSFYTICIILIIAPIFFLSIGFFIITRLGLR